MEVYTNQPGIVIFTPLNFEGIVLKHKNFQILQIFLISQNSIKTGEVYEQKTKFRFSLMNSLDFTP